MKKNLLRKFLFAELIFAGAISSVDGQTQKPFLLKDINPTSNSDSKSFIGLNGKTVFLANDGTNGEELWITDGTTAGTHLIKDINPGSASAEITSMFVYKGKLYFNANDGTNGNEFWTSDGTEIGTEMLKNIYIGMNNSQPGNSFPKYMTLFDDKIFFSAIDNSNGGELWVSDGTDTGTHIFKDIYQGSQGSGPHSLFVFDNKLYFGANDKDHGYELWVSDGTKAGTFMVKDIYTGSGSSKSGLMLDPHFVTYNNKIYFMADNGIDGQELWVSDGTEAGTFMVKDIYTGGNNSQPNDFKVFNGKLYFSAANNMGRHIWETDGTEIGTKMTKYLGAQNSNPTFLTEFNNKLYFSAWDGVTAGKKLWVTDGTEDSTKIVSVKALDHSKLISVSSLTVYNNKLYFISEVETYEYHLCAYDGVHADSIRTIIADPADANSAPFTYAGNYTDNQLSLINGSLYFNAVYLSSVGREPYIFNSSSSSPTAVANIKMFSDFSIYPNPASNLVTLSNISNNTSVNITDLAGKQVYSTIANTTELSINTASFANGVYLVNVTNNGAVATKKLVINK